MKTILASVHQDSTQFVDDISTDELVIGPNMTLAEIEKIVILQSLRRHNQNRTHTARALGIGIRTLQRKIKQYQMDEGQAALERSSLGYTELNRLVAHYY